MFCWPCCLVTTALQLFVFMYFGTTKREEEDTYFQIVKLNVFFKSCNSDAPELRDVARKELGFQFLCGINQVRPRLLWIRRSWWWEIEMERDLIKLEMPCITAPLVLARPGRSMNNYGGCLSPRPTANQSITPQDSDLSQDEESGNLLYISYFWHMPQLLLSSGLKLISETCFNIGGLLEGFASLPEIQILFSKYEFNSICQIISLSFLFDLTRNHIGPVSFRHGLWLFNQIMQIFKLL